MSFFASNDETDVLEDDQDLSTKILTIRSLDFHAMLKLNPVQLADQRLSLLERATSIVSRQNPEIFNRGSSFRRATVKHTLHKQQVDENDEEENFVADENEEGPVQVGKSAHRCSMIKKYNI